MLWKIYFLIAVFEAVLTITSLFFAPGFHIFTQIVMAIIFLIALFGLYEYVFHKQYVPKLFWQYFLGIYLLIDILYLIYSAVPNVPVISSLNFLTIYKDDSELFLNALFGFLIDIPLLYAMYRLTKEEVHKPQKNIKKNRLYPHWGMLQMSLWGYSFVITIFLFILSFFQTGGGNAKTQSADMYSLTFITVLFTPMMLFWLWIIFQYKLYRWNWWRTTLVANGLFYSGSFLISVIFPSSQQNSSGFDIISVLQLLILLISLYVFGRNSLGDRYHICKKAYHSAICY